MLATASAQVCVPLGHSSLYLYIVIIQMMLAWHMFQIGERDNPMYGQLINNLQNVAYYGQYLTYSFAN